MLLEARRTPERDQAAAIRDGFGRHLSEIRASRQLSPDGKRRRIAAAHVAATTQVAALRDQEVNRSADRHAQLEKSLFRFESRTADPASAVSTRDAADRAAALKAPDQALELLQRAQRTSDTDLERAVAWHAAQQGWRPVVAAYAAATRNGKRPSTN